MRYICICPIWIGAVIEIDINVLISENSMKMLNLVLNNCHKVLKSSKHWINISSKTQCNLIRKQRQQQRVHIHQNLTKIQYDWLTNEWLNFASSNIDLWLLLSHIQISCLSSNARIYFVVHSAMSIYIRKRESTAYTHLELHQYFITANFTNRCICKTESKNSRAWTKSECHGLKCQLNGQLNS